MRLKDIKFADAYLGESNFWFGGIGAADESAPAPSEVCGDLDALRAVCVASHIKMGRDDFTVRYEEVAYRASLMQTVSETVFVLRRFPEYVPEFSSLGIHDGIIHLLMKPKITGLVIISGAFGQGKTTTASAYVVDRLAKFGGVAITLEDPPEMPLEGPRGKGVCYQTWVNDGDFSKAARNASRWAPTMIFLGEVRDGHTAAEALKSSINGRLVVCTLHADSVSSSIERMYSMAVSSGLPTDDVSSVLSNGLAAVLHQKLEGNPKKLQTEFMFLRGNEYAGARNMIRDRKFALLGSEIMSQTNRLLYGVGR